MARAGKPLFVQISDTHIGFNKDANPDVNGTLSRTIDLVNALPQQPALLQRFHDQRNVPLLQVANTAVDQLGAAAGSRRTKIHPLQKQNIKAAVGRSTGAAASPQPPPVRVWIISSTVLPIGTGLRMANAISQPCNNA